MTKLLVAGIVLLLLFGLFVSSETPTNNRSHYTAESKPSRESPEKQFETGFVSIVHDGDTITIRSGTRLRKFRLAGIDAPELHQSFGPEAKDYLCSLAPRGTQVSAEITETDKYGREVAFVRAGDLDLNYAMVTNGLAWSHIKFDRDHRFRKPERAAREAGLGLWADPDPTPPWDWKKEHPR